MAHSRNRNRRLLALLAGRPRETARANPDATHDPDAVCACGRGPWRGGTQRKGSLGETIGLPTPFEALPGK